MAQKSKILIIGGTGYIGNLVKAIKEVDVVISTVGHQQLNDQTKILDAIKEAGSVRKFYPSEFGIDVDRHHAVEPAKSTFGGKSQFRRAIEAAGIPHTYLVSNAFAGYFLPTLVQPGATAPPRNKVVILGDGNANAVFNEEHDIGTFTIKSVDDPRTLNKIVYIRPSKNAVSFNEIVAIWEKKIGKTLEKEYVPEEQLLKQIQESPIPGNVILSINHAILVKGDTTNFEIEPSFGVEASELYLQIICDRGNEAEMGVGNRGVEVDTAGSNRVVETAMAFSGRGKAPIPPEWRNDDWIDDMLSSDRAMSYLVEDSGLMNAEYSGSKSIEQSYCTSKSTQGHSSVVDPLQSGLCRFRSVLFVRKKSI
ncbi:OLC1v1007823C1 [Oldenlandia corymbosa var. corymbosa]|uniref:OLC1v1007823C1 n=1 Tax=Oldenlandia corymbosa var. corymbosa TaxID=529605 RepID=A0AAV1DKC1_OLDCO|nr:OLC1v1007823C1 [Oldenlandia corymbosa var. corymbosa]